MARGALLGMLTTLACASQSTPISGEGSMPDGASIEAAPEADLQVSQVEPESEPEPRPHAVPEPADEPPPPPILEVAEKTAAPGKSEMRRPVKPTGKRKLLVGGPAPSVVDPALAAGSGDAYRDTPDEGFIAVAQDSRSTFSIDVDTASYSNVRRFLLDGSLPPPAAVRIEELVNYFDYDYPEPRGKAPFAVASEVGPCPWDPSHRVVSIGIQGKHVDAAQVPVRNLVFLLDVSGSMESPDKLPLLKRAFGMLVESLRPQDRVSIVVYAGASGVVLPPTPGDDRGAILAALEHLSAGGSTNGGAGIHAAYAMARQAFVQGGINRVILATDGDFNVGTTSDAALVQLIEQQRNSGVFLSVLGFGRGNLNDAMMEQIADKGNGNYAYIDGLTEARKVLVEQAGSTLVTIAKDVKIQVEFNPAAVSRYRLIGYANRKLDHADFTDDRKDAGEIGAGHSVTALYEVEPITGASGTGATIGGSPCADSQATPGCRLLDVHIRYKAPHGHRSDLLTFPVLDAGASTTSDDFRFANAVALFGMLLRESPHAGGATYDVVKALARGARGADPHGRRSEFTALVDRAASLAARG